MLRKVQRLLMRLRPLQSRQATFLMETAMGKLVVILWYLTILILLVLSNLRHWRGILEGRQLVYHWLVRFSATVIINHKTLSSGFLTHQMFIFLYAWTPDKDAMFSGNFKFTSLLLTTPSPSPKKLARWTDMVYRYSLWRSVNMRTLNIHHSHYK
jgi:hypothetical protein